MTEKLYGDPDRRDAGWVRFIVIIHLREGTHTHTHTCPVPQRTSIPFSDQRMDKLLTVWERSERRCDSLKFQLVDFGLIGGGDQN